MKLLVIILGFLFLASPAFSQQSYPLSTAKFNWTWVRGTNPGVDDGLVTAFNIKCGSASGQYTTIFSIPDPAARSILIRPVIGGSGTYFCVITALNGALESNPSPEVFFSAVVPASTPGNWGVGP